MSNQPMRIGFLVMNVGKNAGGPESYERALLQEFSKQAPEIEFHLFCLVPPTSFIRSLGEKNFIVYDLSDKNRLLALAYHLPRKIKQLGLSLFHAPFVPPPFTRASYLFTHHCFSPYNHPEFYDRAILARLRPLITRGLRKAKHVLCVSENVRTLSAEVLKVPPEKMTVVHNGIDSFFEPIEAETARAALREEYKIEGPFFFFAGKLQKRKNVARILEAYRHFLDQTDSSVNFVLAGSRTWASDDLDALIDRYQLKGSFSTST